MSLSLIIPVYNEKNLILKNIPIMYDYLKGLKFKFEILICDNGSTDYENIKFSQKEIKYLRIDKKGLGLGIKLGIENATFDNLMFYAIDLPFGLDIIKNSFEMMNEYDIVIGSKGHKESINNHTFKRKLFSFAFNSLVNVFFGLGIKDTQGSLMFKKVNVLKYLDKLDSEDAFLETQILIYGKKNKNRIIEIPVNYKAQRSGSKIHPISDGIKIFKDVLKEKLK